MNNILFMAIWLIHMIVALLLRSFGADLSLYSLIFGMAAGFALYHFIIGIIRGIRESRRESK